MTDDAKRNWKRILLESVNNQTYYVSVSKSLANTQHAYPDRTPPHVI